MRNIQCTINHNLAILLVWLLISSCSTDEKRLFIIDEEYRKNFPKVISEEREYYLQLAGLFELDPQKQNSFGSEEDNDFVIDIENLPPKIGYFQILGDSIRLFTTKGLDVIDNNGKLTKDETVNLNEVYQYERWRWSIIERANLYFLRFWDLKNPAVDKFIGFDRFDLNADFIFDAKFEYYAIPKRDLVDSELGRREVEFIGKATFKYNEVEYSLDVMEEGFLIIGDRTNTQETYAGGRYMYLKVPKSDSTVIIDFNHCYNPSCAYSEFTTCLFPPEQNVLPFKILAGEKYEDGKEYFRE